MNYLSPQDWSVRESKLDQNEIDVAFLCGLLYTQKTQLLEPLAAPVLANPRYQNSAVYYSDIVVRGDRGLEKFEDLRGVEWGYNELGSFSGHYVVCDYLANIGENHGYFKKVQKTGSHYSSIKGILEKKIDAAAIDSTVLERTLTLEPELKSQLKIISSIGPNPIPPVTVRRSLDPNIKEQLKKAFIELHLDPSIKALLNEHGIDHFVPVDDAYYDQIRNRNQAVHWVTLTPEVPERSFANYKNIQIDQTTLYMMLDKLRKEVQQVPQPTTLNLTEPSGKLHRLVIFNPQKLQLESAASFTLIGFFGTRSEAPEETRKEVTRTDDKLVEQLFKLPEALVYSSLELEDGNWGNLVLMLGDDHVIDAWRVGATHRYATTSLAPQVYNTIRLHNGRLPAGLNSQPEFRRVKLIDYRKDGNPYSIFDLQ